MPLCGLKLNNDKTEFLFIHLKYCSYLSQPNIIISNDTVPSSMAAKNLGFVFDSNPSLKPHFSSTCKSAFFQLRRTSHICKFLTVPAAKTIVHSLIAFHLDYCNSALSGLCDCDI